MSYKDLGLSQKTIDETLDGVNPLRLLLSDEWNKPGAGDYRENAYKRALDLNVPFQTEDNTVFTLVPKIVQIFNPKSGNKMEYSGGSGSGDMYHLRFVDPITKDEIFLNVSSDAIGFRPEGDKKTKSKG